MTRTCPKCGFANAEATGSATEACPKCGVIYAKAEAAAKPATAPVPPPPAAAAPTRHEMRLPLWPTIACVICLVVGFFIGREQMRYQIASAVTGAFAHAFDGLNKAPSTPVAAPATPKAEAPKPETPAAPPKPEPISAKLVKKGFREQDFSGGHYIKAAITFTVEFHNDTDKDIRAFDGVLAFNDLLGNRVHAAKLTISDPIKAGQSFKWEGEMEYNQFMSQHTTLRGYSMNDTAITLKVHKILFADGTSQTEGEN